MKTLKTWLTILSFFFVTGCIPAVQDRNLKSSSDYSTKSDVSIVVIGIKTNWRLQAFRGTNEEDGWEQDFRAKASFNTSPSNGYIVYKIQPSAPGESYGIARFIDVDGDIELLCSGDKVITFSVLPNSVIYYGDIYIEDSGDGLVMKLTSEYDRAKQYVSKHHSVIANKLTNGSLKVQKATRGECGISHSPITSIVQIIMSDEPTIDDQQ